MMGWTASDGIAVPIWPVVIRTEEEPSAMSISMVGLDLAKSVFQIHGIEASGMVVVRRQLRRAQVEPFCVAAALCGWDGGVRRSALLGTPVAAART